jgi:hypothetical protein
MLSMRLFAGLLMTGTMLLLAQTAGEKEAIAAVQRIFDGIAAHDDAMIRSAMLPSARIYAIREMGGEAGLPTSTGMEDLISQIVAEKGALQERFTAAPRVLIRGRIAQVWGEYEFLRDGKFHHCGVDSVSLLLTANGWKIATIVYTAETTGCHGAKQP